MVDRDRDRESDRGRESVRETATGRGCKEREIEGTAEDREGEGKDQL